MTRARPAPTDDSDRSDLLGRTVLDILSALPPSSRGRADDPAAASRELTGRAAAKAGLAAGALALPLGPLGWLTLLPELATVWRLQAALVVDIAAVHGHPPPPPELVLQCLFQHTGGHALREVLAQAGERGLVQLATSPLGRLLAARLGAMVLKRLAGRGLARWVPVAGALGLAAWAAWDTRQVARNAQAAFSRPRLR
jgi:hypothetical protein